MICAAREGARVYLLRLARLSAPLAIGVCLIASTLAAEDAPTKLAGWGQFVDPAGDCKVQEEKGVVTITVPATQHNLNPEPDYDNLLAPRLLQKVDGDFRIQVNVAPFPRPKANTSTTKQGHSYVAAGLVVWQDDKTFVRWFRAALGKRGDLFVHGEAFSGAKRQDYRVLVKDRIVPDTATHLSVERTRGQFTFSWSDDGRRWTDFGRLPDKGYAKELQVGVAVVNSANVSFAPTFEGLQLKPGKE